VSSTEGGYQERLEAQIAHRMLRGDQPDEILAWFQKEYPADPVANYYAALGGAEQQYENALAYQRLEDTDTFGELFPSGSDIYQRHDLFLNVGIPLSDGRSFWTTVRMEVTVTMKKGDIEQQAIEIASERVPNYIDSGSIIDANLNKPSVGIVRGLVI
jgi:hypothetical protein